MKNIILDYASQLSPESGFIIDGGWLLHVLKWKRNSSYAEIMKQYSSYLTTKYGMLCVIFGGYEKHSVKDHGHRYQQKGKLSATIVISENTKAHKDQQAFFANYQNKTQFISLLAKHVEVFLHCIKISTV